MPRKRAVIIDASYVLLEAKPVPNQHGGSATLDSVELGSVAGSLVSLFCNPGDSWQAKAVGMIWDSKTSLYDRQMCCQLLTKLFGQTNRKIRPLAKKSNILINKSKSIYYYCLLHTISLGKGKEKSKISGDEVYFSADI
jgi:hypothetical protein